MERDGGWFSHPILLAPSVSRFAGKDPSLGPQLLTCSNPIGAFTLDTRLPPHACAIVETGKLLHEYCLQRGNFTV